MDTFFVFCSPGADVADELLRRYETEFVPAVKTQSGFRGCTLLRSYGRDDRTAKHPWVSEADLIIQLVFESRGDRGAWVASAEHRDVWPRIEELCENLAVLGSTRVATEGKA